MKMAESTEKFGWVKRESIPEVVYTNATKEGKAQSPQRKK